MAEKQKADSQTITQLQQQLRDLQHSCQLSKNNEKRLRVTLQDANFDLQDAQRLISQVQHRSKRQDSVLREMAAVAAPLHKKAQVRANTNQPKR